MEKAESRLASVEFWLWVGTVNHAIALLVLSLGCAYSGFSCEGESMREILSIYAFTLFTPQLALEAILLLALLLVSNSLQELRDSSRLLVLFTVTLSLLILFLYWQN